MTRLLFWIVTAFIINTPAMSDILEAPPAVCYVQIIEKKKVTRCSAVLIDKRIAATAAHCISNNITNPKADIQLHCGLKSQARAGGEMNFSEKFRVIGFDVSRGWRISQSSSSDFAFLVLDRDTTLAPLPIHKTSEDLRSQFFYPSPTSTGDYELKPTVECRYSGFGYDQMRDVNFFRTVDKSPRSGLKGYISSNTMSNSSLIIDSWGKEIDVMRHGDSGGPFYCRSDPSTSWFLVSLIASKLVYKNGKDEGTNFLSLVSGEKFQSQFSRIEAESVAIRAVILHQNLIYIAK